MMPSRAAGLSRSHLSLCDRHVAAERYARIAAHDPRKNAG
jgi:hypothetical protein